MIVSKRFLDKINIILDSKIAEFIHSVSRIDDKSECECRFNYIDISNRRGVVTFLPPNKKSSDPFKDESRGETKIGRLARYLLKESKVEFTDSEIEDFVNSYKSTLSNLDDRFEIVKGEDIKYWYNQKNYANQDGHLGNSCMKNKPKGYFDLYSKNKNVSLLILTKNVRRFPWIMSKKKLIGRALIWNVDTSPCESKIYMDRIYTSDTSDQKKFIRLAESNGWMYYDRGYIAYRKSLIGPCNELDISVKIMGNHESYPYLDSFRCMNLEKNILRTSSNQFYDPYYYGIHHMDGGFSTCDNDYYGSNQ